MKLNGNTKKKTADSAPAGKSAAPQKAPPKQRASAAAPAASSRPARGAGMRPPAKKALGGVKNRMPIIIAGIAVALVVVVFIGLGVYVNSLDTVYPNVSVSGIQLGGKDARAAESLLNSAGFNSYEDKSITVTIPVGSSAGGTLVISAEDAGVAVSSASAARMAYDYGRDGNFFTNIFAYLGCAIGGKNLDFNAEFTIDREYVKSEVARFASDINAMFMETETTIGEDSVKIIKGGSAALVDEDDLYSIIENAFRNEDYSEITYRPEVSDAADVDLQKIFDSVHKDPVNSEYDKETGGVTDHVNGISFDMEEARKLWDEAENGDEVVIPLIVTEPEVTSALLQSRLFADVLGQKSTSLGGSSASRVNNITLAASSVNGTILNPGEEFSYNDVVGQRTTARGYQAAGAYANGEVVQEVGGGICQVSSTVYYAALLANLEITDRTCHYFGVSYLPAGLDATVSWGGPEFKFKNNRDYPIKIEAYTDMTSYTVVIKIHGTDVDGSYVLLTSETWNMNNGYGAVSYRWVYDKNGNLIEKVQEATSQYHYHTDDSDTSPSASPSPSPSQTPDATPSPDSTTTTPPATTNPGTQTTPPAETVPPPTETAAPPAETAVPTVPVTPNDSTGTN